MPNVQQFARCDNGPVGARTLPTPILTAAEERAEALWALFANLGIEFDEGSRKPSQKTRVLLSHAGIEITSD